MSTIHTTVLISRINCQLTATLRNNKRHNRFYMRKHTSHGAFVCLPPCQEPILCNPVNCSMPGFPTLHYLPEFAQTHVHWVSHTIQTSPLSPPSPTVLNLSQHQCLLEWVSSTHQVARDWSFSFSISPSNEYSGLISFRIDWLDLLVVHGTLKSLLQCHNLTSIHDYWKKA